MTRRALLGALAIALLLLGTALGAMAASQPTINENYVIVSDNGKTFVTTELTEISFDIDIGEAEFVCLSGNNIASGDYSYSQGTVTFAPIYLASLAGGERVFVVETTRGRGKIRINIDDTLAGYQVLNGDFGTGDLSGWTVRTVFKEEEQIQAFVASGVRSDGAGGYYYGADSSSTWYERMGSMRSTGFELGGSGVISFRLGGGRNTDLCYLSVHRESDHAEIARFGNSAFDGTASLVSYRADLSPFLGQRLYIQVYDIGAASLDCLTLAEIVTYHPDQQTAVGTAAVSTRPLLNTELSTPQLANGNFASGLNFWTVSGSSTAFRIDGSTLKSNAGGDGSVGLIRSQLFSLEGSGFVSFRIGAAQGARYDKDTFISVREYLTNREIARFANTRRNGNTMMLYYADLSQYLGKMLYFEIVDNATGSWDTIFVSEINTHYAVRPEYDPLLNARNLCY